MTCGECGQLLVVVNGAVDCLGPCSVPMYGGMVDPRDLLERAPRVRCTAGGCGWEGVPTFWDGLPLTECPRCEGARERYPDPGRGFTWKLRRRRRPAPEPPQSRNSPCACGSGKKFKKCCGV